jgi:ectoine hydroxylase-related dioxygenase (phytanoyl-CoA dioxygenase family)
MNAASAVRNSLRSPAGNFSDLGFQIFPAVLSESDSDTFASELTKIFEREQSGSRRRIGGVRNLLRLSPRVSQLADSPRLLSLIEQATERVAFPVRAIFFDKTAGANWRVPWHQDLTIAVTKRIETDGFGPWSTKDGVVHVQPALEILKNMTALRLHLDACDESNGALRVIPGSHLDGELSAERIEAMTGSARAVTCEVPKGGALLVRPLLLHASSPAKSPSHRRVLHIEYACDELPNGLEWFDR